MKCPIHGTYDENEERTLIKYECPKCDEEHEDGICHETGEPIERCWCHECKANMEMVRADFIYESRKDAW